MEPKWIYLARPKPMATLAKSFEKIPGLDDDIITENPPSDNTTLEDFEARFETGNENITAAELKKKPAEKPEESTASEIPPEKNHEVELKVKGREGEAENIPIHTESEPSSSPSRAKQSGAEGSHADTTKITESADDSKDIGRTYAPVNEEVPQNPTDSYASQEAIEEKQKSLENEKRYEKGIKTLTEEAKKIKEKFDSSNDEKSNPIKKIIEYLVEKLEKNETRPKNYEGLRRLILNEVAASIFRAPEDIPKDKFKVFRVWLAKVMIPVDLEITPVEEGKTKADSRVHEITGTKSEDALITGSVAEIILPGFRNVSNGEIIRRPTVMRAEGGRGFAEGEEKKMQEEVKKEYQREKTYDWEKMWEEVIGTEKGKAEPARKKGHEVEPPVESEGKTKNIPIHTEGDPPPSPSQAEQSGAEGFHHDEEETTKEKRETPNIKKIEKMYGGVENFNKIIQWHKKLFELTEKENRIDEETKEVFQLAERIALENYAATIRIQQGKELQDATNTLNQNNEKEMHNLIKEWVKDESLEIRENEDKISLSGKLAVAIGNRNHSKLANDSKSATVWEEEITKLKEALRESQIKNKSNKLEAPSVQYDDLYINTFEEIPPDPTETPAEEETRPEPRVFQGLGKEEYSEEEKIKERTRAFGGEELTDKEIAALRKTKQTGKKERKTPEEKVIPEKEKSEETTTDETKRLTEWWREEPTARLESNRGAYAKAEQETEKIIKKTKKALKARGIKLEDILGTLTITTEKKIKESNPNATEEKIKNIEKEAEEEFIGKIVKQPSIGKITAQAIYKRERAKAEYNEAKAAEIQQLSKTATDDKAREELTQERIKTEAAEVVLRATHEELDLLEQARAEALPAKEKGIVKTCFEKWNKVPRKYKIALSAVAAGGIGLATGGAAVAATAGGVSVARSFAAFFAGKGAFLGAETAISWWEKNVAKGSKSKEGRVERLIQEKSAEADSLDLDIENLETWISDTENKIQHEYKLAARRKKLQNIGKLMSAAAAGIIAGKVGIALGGELVAVAETTTETPPPEDLPTAPDHNELDKDLEIKSEDDLSYEEAKTVRGKISELTEQGNTAKATELRAEYGGLLEEQVKNSLKQDQPDFFEQHKDTLQIEEDGSFKIREAKPRIGAQGAIEDKFIIDENGTLRTTGEYPYELKPNGKKWEEVAPETPPANAEDYIETVKQDDSVWRITERQLEEHGWMEKLKTAVVNNTNQEHWKQYAEGYKTHLIDQIEDIIKEHPGSFGLKDPDLIIQGQEVDLTHIFSDETQMQEMVNEAAGIEERAAESIIENNEHIEQEVDKWQREHEGESLASPEHKSDYNRIFGRNTDTKQPEVAQQPNAKAPESQSQKAETEPTISENPPSRGITINSEGANQLLNEEDALPAQAVDPESELEKSMPREQAATETNETDAGKKPSSWLINNVAEWMRRVSSDETAQDVQSTNPPSTGTTEPLENTPEASPQDQENPKSGETATSESSAPSFQEVLTALGEKVEKLSIEDGNTSSLFTGENANVMKEAINIFVRKGLGGNEETTGMIAKKLNTYARELRCGEEDILDAFTEAGGSYSAEQNYDNFQKFVEDKSNEEKLQRIAYTLTRIKKELREDASNGK